MIFIDIEHMLDKLKATDRNEDLMRLALPERLKWCFPKQHVTYLLAQLESLKLSLIVMLRILQLGSVIKANIDDGIDTDSLASAADDAIAQEKAESQNMIIVRYWSVRRLDRLWDLVAQEAMDAAKDPTNQKINANYSNIPSAMKSLVATSPDATRLPVITFGDSDVGLSDMERSPKDMVQLSESAMNRLLSMWVPHSSRPSGRGHSSQNHPRVYVSDTEDCSDELDFDGHDVHGYYLEGKTDDWRNPHSQEARQHAARLRQEYSRYQAHVESESEPDATKHRDRDRGIDSEEERDTLRPQNTSPVNMRRPHSQSLSDHHDRHYSHSSGSFPPPSQPYRPHNQPTTNQLHNQYKYQAPAPRSIPTHYPNHPTSNPIPMPMPVPNSPRTQNQVHFEQHRPKPRTHALSSSSPESRISDHRTSPRSAQRSPSHRREREQRHKDLKRDATRGLLGVGAIAGFMDALEAFSIL